MIGGTVLLKPRVVQTYTILLRPKHLRYHAPVTNFILNHCNLGFNFKNAPVSCSLWMLLKSLGDADSKFVVELRNCLWFIRIVQRFYETTKNNVSLNLTILVDSWHQNWEKLFRLDISLLQEIDWFIHCMISVTSLLKANIAQILTIHLNAPNCISDIIFDKIRTIRPAGPEFLTQSYSLWMHLNSIGIRFNDFGVQLTFEL